MRLAVVLVFSALSALATLGQAEMVAPGLGVLRQGETDAAMCSLAWCPADPLCTMAEVHLRATLHVVGSEGDAVTLSAPGLHGEASAVAHGPLGSASVEVRQGDGCPEVFVQGTRIHHTAAYRLELEELT